MIWNFYSRTNSRQVSWLADPRAMTAFPIPLESVTVHDNGHALPAYSDEIVQDFHLFPFYPRPQSGPRHQLLFTRYVLYPITEWRKMQ